MQGSKRNETSKRDNVFDAAGYHVPTSVSLTIGKFLRIIETSMRLLGSKSNLDRWKGTRRCCKYSLHAWRPLNLEVIF